MTLRPIALLLTALTLIPAVAGAQQAPAVSPGTRVRVWTTPGAEPFEGSVVDRTDQSVTLSIKGMPQPVVVPRDSITRFDVSRGRRSRSKTALTPLLGARLTLRF